MGKKEESRSGAAVCSVTDGAASVILLLFHDVLLGKEEVQLTRSPSLPS